MPKSVTRVTKDGIKFTSNVDKAQYSIRELSRAALRDSAKFIRRRMNDDVRKLPGLKRSRRAYRSNQYWVRKWENDLQIGFKHGTWYGVDQELGTNNQPARNILRNSVYNNISEIRRIQGQYLSAIADDNKIKGLVDESEQTSPDGPER